MNKSYIEETTRQNWTMVIYNIRKNEKSCCISLSQLRRYWKRKCKTWLKSLLRGIWIKLKQTLTYTLYLFYYCWDCSILSITLFSRIRFHFNKFTVHCLYCVTSHGFQNWLIDYSFPFVCYVYIITMILNFWLLSMSCVSFQIYGPDPSKSKWSIKSHLFKKKWCDYFTDFQIIFDTYWNFSETLDYYAW
jgi:hypothetical protein